VNPVRYKLNLYMLCRRKWIASVGLVVRVPGYITEIYCDSCEVQTEFMYVMYKKVDRLCGLVVNKNL
jgi:hypothetical protein